jgi:ubiquinone biosynthesis protein
MPELIRDYLTLATRGRLELRIASDDLKAIERRVARGQRLAGWLALGTSLLLAGSLALLLPRAGLSSGVVEGAGGVAIVGAVLALWRALRNS